MKKELYHQGGKEESSCSQKAMAQDMKEQRATNPTHEKKVRKHNVQNYIFTRFSKYNGDMGRGSSVVRACMYGRSPRNEFELLQRRFEIRAR